MWIMFAVQTDGHEVACICVNEGILFEAATYSTHALRGPVHVSYRTPLYCCGLQRLNSRNICHENGINTAACRTTHEISKISHMIHACASTTLQRTLLSGTILRSLSSHLLIQRRTGRTKGQQVVLRLNSRFLDRVAANSILLRPAKRVRCLKVRRPQVKIAQRVCLNGSRPEPESRTRERAKSISTNGSSHDRCSSRRHSTSVPIIEMVHAR